MKLFKVGDSVLLREGSRFCNKLHQIEGVGEVISVVFGAKDWYRVQDKNGRTQEYQAEDLDLVSGDIKVDDEVVVNFGDKIVGVEGVVVHAADNFIVVQNTVDQLVLTVDQSFVTLKGKPTPLSIPWGLVADNWNYAAMDEDGDIYFYEEEPKFNVGLCGWTETDTISNASDLMKIPTEDIVAELSLTKREE